VPDLLVALLTSPRVRARPLHERLRLLYRAHAQGLPLCPSFALASAEERDAARTASRLLTANASMYAVAHSFDELHLGRRAEQFLVDMERAALAPANSRGSFRPSPHAIPVPVLDPGPAPAPAPANSAAAGRAHALVLDRLREDVHWALVAAARKEDADAPFRARLLRHLLHTRFAALQTHLAPDLACLVVDYAWMGSRQ
jgi:hypothetical protein